MMCPIDMFISRHFGCKRKLKGISIFCCLMFEKTVSEENKEKDQATKRKSNGVVDFLLILVRGSYFLPILSLKECRWQKK